MSNPRERRAVRFLAHARDERRRVVEHPVLERPGPAPWFARAFAVVAQVGEPDVEPGGAEEVRHAPGRRSVRGMQPEPMVRKGAMDEQHRWTPVAKCPQPVQRQLDAVRGRDPPRAPGHS